MLHVRWDWATAATVEPLKQRTLGTNSWSLGCVLELLAVTTPARSMFVGHACSDLLLLRERGFSAHCYRESAVSSPQSYELHTYPPKRDRSPKRNQGWKEEFFSMLQSIPHIEG